MADLKASQKYGQQKFLQLPKSEVFTHLSFATRKTKICQPIIHKVLYVERLADHSCSAQAELMYKTIFHKMISNGL